MDVGIVSYGAYVPIYRITPETIGNQWGRDGKDIGKALGVKMKSVPGPDEDTATMAVEAARRTMDGNGVKPSDIGAIYVGSESHPYAVKPTGTIVAEALQATNEVMTADLEFACKAATAGIQISLGLVRSNMTDYALTIGSDTAQGAPANMLEYTAAAGAGALLIGRTGLIATIDNTVSFTSDTPDFWRRAERKYPRHGGRFTGKPAYFRHVISCAKLLFDKAGTGPEDYDHAIFHQPNAKFPSKAGKILGFGPEKLNEGLVVKEIGNTYSGATLLGLIAVLDVSEPGDRIFVVSYGSGAGSDGFDIRVTDRVEQHRKRKNCTLRERIEDYRTIDYGTYAKYLNKFKLGASR